MKKKNRLALLVLGLFIFLGSLGECGMFGKPTLTKKQQEQMVLYTNNNYEDIKKIEFQEARWNSATGTFKCDALINDTIYVKYTLWGKNGEVGMSQLLSRNDGQVLVRRSEELSRQDFTNIDIIFLED